VVCVISDITHSRSRFLVLLTWMLYWVPVDAVDFDKSATDWSVQFFRSCLINSVVCILELLFTANVHCYVLVVVVCFPDCQFFFIFYSCFSVLFTFSFLSLLCHCFKVMICMYVCYMLFNKYSILNIVVSTDTMEIMTETPLKNFSVFSTVQIH